MGKLLEWMRGIVLLFFLLTALLYFIPRDVYKKYIRFFMEMVLVLAILLPVMKLFYGEDPFGKMVHYDEFWQELSNLKTDMEHMEYYRMNIMQNSMSRRSRQISKAWQMSMGMRRKRCG